MSDKNGDYGCYWSFLLALLLLILHLSLVPRNPGAPVSFPRLFYSLFMFKLVGVDPSLQLGINYLRK